MLQNKYFKMIRGFLRGYDKELYASDFVEKTGLSQKNVALTLIELERMGILKSRLSKNRRYYSLNLVNPMIKDYIILFELYRKIEFLEKNKKLIDFSEAVRGDIVCVFGSYAKGTHKKHSDLDLLVVGDVDSRGVRKIGRRYGYDVQVFALSSEDFGESLRKGSPLIAEILEEHVLLKGHDKFIGGVLNG